jgi:hypothetical protein
MQMGRGASFATSAFGYLAGEGVGKKLGWASRRSGTTTTTRRKQIWQRVGEGYQHHESRRRRRNSRNHSHPSTASPPSSIGISTCTRTQNTNPSHGQSLVPRGRFLSEHTGLAGWKAAKTAMDTKATMIVPATTVREHSLSNVLLFLFISYTYCFSFQVSNFVTSAHGNGAVDSVCSGHAVSVYIYPLPMKIPCFPSGCLCEPHEHSKRLHLYTVTTQKTTRQLSRRHPRWRPPFARQ